MSLHITQQFRRAIEGDPTKCILWVGAGLSASTVRQGGKGLPDWAALMQHMIDELRDSANCDEPTLQNLDAALKQKKYLEVAQIYKQRTRPDQFAGFIKTEFDPSDICDSSVHRAILDVRFRGIITTNFDRVFEQQSDLLVPLVFPQCLDDIDGFRRHGFFAKIHGCVRMTASPADNLVLTDESYQRLRVNPKYQIILRSCIVMHPILTVGFSLVDPDFLGLMDDLRQSLGDNMPTIYSLMRDPGAALREDWLKRGVQIIPYTNHTEILGFFQELVQLSSNKHPTPALAPTSKLSEIDFDALAERWRRERTLADASAILDEQIELLAPTEEKEAFLFRLLAVVSFDESIRLAPALVSLGTVPADRALVQVFQRAEELSSYHHLQPNPEIVAVRKWVAGHWRQLAEAGETNTLEWLVDEKWSDGIGPNNAFNDLVRQVCTEEDWERVPDLYSVSYRYELASQTVTDRFSAGRVEIERIVLNPKFVTALKKGEMRTPRHRVQESIQVAEFQKRLKCKAYKSFGEVIAEGDTRGRQFLEVAIEHLLEEFRGRSYLTIHGSSSLYDPDQAKGIVDALAGIKSTGGQQAVFWTFSQRPERRRGWLGTRDELRIMEEELLRPLWWRFSSETRIDYWEHRHHRTFREPSSFESGPEFLLTELMGLTYDSDREFRRDFKASLTSFKTADREQRYEPRAIQEMWRARELKYAMSDEAPPELARRIAATRKDWDNQRDADVRWGEARERADRAFKDGQLGQWFSTDRKSYAIDNLLGAYFPTDCRVVLYRKMIERAAKDLAVDEDALSTVVFIHETVHAFSHVGRDLDGTYWKTFALPKADSLDGLPSATHEAIAQFFTFKLLERLQDDRLMKTFLSLESVCLDVYRAWRATEHYTPEQMRDALMKCRRAGDHWPPV